MIEQTARVIRLFDQKAEVLPQNESACGSCSASKSCGTSLLSKVFGAKPNHLLVDNTLQAKPGDMVILGLPENSLPRISFLFYILPILTLFIFAIAGDWLGSMMNANTTEPYAILGGLLGLLIGLKAVGFYSQSIANREAYQAVMLRRSNDQIIHFITE